MMEDNNKSETIPPVKPNPSTDTVTCQEGSIPTSSSSQVPSVQNNMYPSPVNNYLNQNYPSAYPPTTGTGPAYPPATGTGPAYPPTGTCPTYPHFFPPTGTGPAYPPFPPPTGTGPAYPPSTGTGQAYPPSTGTGPAFPPFPHPNGTNLAYSPPTGTCPAYPPSTGTNSTPPSHQWTRPILTDDDKTVTQMKIQFESAISKQKQDGAELRGIAILLIAEDSSAPAGTVKDEERINETFRELGFGVWSVINPTFKKIASVVHICTTHPYMTSTWCKTIVMYYAGHGGSHDSKPYIIPVSSDSEETQSRYYYIEAGLVYPFQPNEAPLLSDRYRLFFFDCCMSETKSNHTTFPPPPPLTSLPQYNSASSSLPPRGLCLVAYATSMHYKASGSLYQGGIWTRKLVENIRNYDLPISVLLDMTYEDVAMETSLEGKLGHGNVQGPHYSSSLGLFYLRAPSKRKDPFKEFKCQETTVTSVSSSLPLPAATKQPENEVIVIDNIMNKVPEKADLEASLWLLKKATPEQWRDKFGKRIIKQVNDKEKRLLTTNSVESLVNLIYNQIKPRWPTWRQIIKALEDPTNVKVDDPMEGTINVANTVREYMGQDCIYVKYKEQV